MSKLECQEIPMVFLRAFLPWIVFAVFPASIWQWGALSALLVAAALIIVQRRAGRPVDGLIIEIGSAAFFAVLAVVAFIAPDSGVHPYSAALANGTLTLIAVISMLVRHPFTLGIAKQTTPREYWDMPEFLRFNMIITSVWAVAFAATAIAIALIAHAGSGHLIAIMIAQVVGLAAPIIFTNRYVAHVQAKVAAARGDAV
jgi:hypothetical protein